MMCSPTSACITQNPGDRRGLPDGVGVVCPSPDGKHIAVCGPNHTVEVWDAHVHHRRFTSYGHQDGLYRRLMGHVLAIAWSPDGTRLASVSSNGSLHVWDARTGIHQRTVWPASCEMPTHAQEQPCALSWETDGLLHLKRAYGQTLEQKVWSL